MWGNTAIDEVALKGKECMIFMFITTELEKGVITARQFSRLLTEHIGFQAARRNCKKIKYFRNSVQNSFKKN